MIAAQRSITGDTDRLEIAGALASQSPHGSTPVGQGLLRARDGLASLPPPDAAAAKAIVLLSDGLQNVAPTVNGTEPTAIDAVQSFSASGVAIYSIFFGDETGWGYSLMEEIKNQTGGDLVIGTSTGLGLAAAYLSIRGLVDDLVYFEPNGETSLAEPWPSFEVPFDQNPGPATVALAWELGDGRTRLTVDLRRKGEPAWQLGSQLSPLAGSSFLVFRFKPGPGSSWEFRVRQTAPQSGTTVPVGRARFAAAVYSAVASAQLRASLADRGFVAGQPLPIEAELGSAGQPVLGATVTARVKAPARPFGTTLRRYAGRFQPAQGPDSAQVSGLAAQLADFLRRDQGSAELYPSRELTLRLHDDGQAPDRLAGDGVYSGLLAAEETRIAGPYEVTVEAQVTDGRGRELRRTARLATLAGVAPADPLQSSVAVALGPPNADGSRRAMRRSSVVAASG
ncbi:MAG TPA: hypothetical protein PK413_17230, partial [Thermoanaerobaculia bacterium]|nr:hypothetical protein [Thermoanaerobaculia bacterium]